MRTLKVAAARLSLENPDNTYVIEATILKLAPHCRNEGFTYETRLGDIKYRTTVDLKAMDGTIFREVDLQSPATSAVLYYNAKLDIPPREAHQDPTVYKRAYEAILFDSESAVLSNPRPTVFRFALNASEVWNSGGRSHWGVRCGTVTYIDQPAPCSTEDILSFHAKNHSSSASSSSAASGPSSALTSAKEKDKKGDKAGL